MVITFARYQRINVRAMWHIRTKITRTGTEVGSAKTNTSRLSLSRVANMGQLQNAREGRARNDERRSEKKIRVLS